MEQKQEQIVTSGISFGMNGRRISKHTGKIIAKQATR